MDGFYVLIGLLVVALLIGGLIFSAYLVAQRRKALGAWTASKGLDFSPGHQSDYDHRFPAFGCLQQGSNRYAYNVMEGDWSGRRFQGFDYHHETYSTDSKGHRQTHHHHMSAVILASVLPLKPLFIRPEGFLDKITEFFGYDDIDFESAEFSRRFFVKAQDRRWAYDVLHARTLEFLLESPSFTIQFDGTCVIAYRGQTFGVADFEAAGGVVVGILERLPEYLRQQLTQGTA